MPLLPETLVGSTLAPGTVTSTGTTGGISHQEQTYKKLNHLGVLAVADCGADPTGAADASSALNDAVALLAGKQGIVGIDGKLRVAANYVFPDNVTLAFLTDGMLVPDNGVKITYNQGAFICGERQIFDLSNGGSIVAPKVPGWWSRWFGTKGDDSHNDSAGLQACADTAVGSGRNANIIVGAGIFRQTVTLTYGGPNLGCSLIGVPDGTYEQGSANSVCILKWEGGAAEQVNAGGFVHVKGIAFQNWGTATNAVKTSASGERAWVEGCSFLVPSGGAVPWTSGSLYLYEFNYSYVAHCEFGSAPAIRFGPYGTSCWIGNGVVIDCPSASGDTAIVFDATTAMTALTLGPAFTFNGEPPCGTLFDNTNSTGLIGVVNIIGADLTTNVQAPSSQPVLFKGRNIASLRVQGTKIHQFNQPVDALFLVRNCNVIVEGCSGESNPVLVRGVDQAGEQSYIYAGGANAFNPSNTKGVHDGINSTAIAASFIPCAPGAEGAGISKIHLEKGLQSGTVYRCPSPTGATPADTLITLAGPTDSSHAGALEHGRVFYVELVNSSAIPYTFGWSTKFAWKLAGAPAALPVGQSLTILFRWDGTHAVELMRSAVG